METNMTYFKMKPVSSSSIKGYSYDENSHILRVWYLNGHVYDYINISKLIYERLDESPSKGEYINRIIKEFNFKKAD